MNENVLSHLIRKIESTQIQEHPYSYFHSEGIFPDSFYRELLENLPDPSLFSSGKDYPNRRHINFLEHPLEMLPFQQTLFWEHLSSLLASQELASALLKKFDSTKPLEQLGVYLSLIRDQSQYFIGPHTDHGNKIVTLLFYLPATAEQRHLGTSLYIPKNRAFTCPGDCHHRFEDFEKALTVPFLPNSVFGFHRSDVSFHGVEPIAATEKERILLSYTLWESPRKSEKLSR